MDRPRLRFLFLNLGHAYAHLFLLIYPTVVLTLEYELGRPYGELLLPSTAGFVAFAAGTLPAGWLGDRWSREGMLVLMFLGLGLGALVTALAGGPLALAAGLGLIGLAAAIYHPVGIAMVVEVPGPTGRALGINGVAGNLGVAAAPVLAAGLSAGLGWRWAFLVPGAVALATGLGYWLLVRGGESRHRRAAGSTRGPVEVVGRERVIAFLVVSGLFGGLIFHATTIALPKIFEEALSGRLEALGGALVLGAGGLASLVFAGAAFAQIGVGWMIDRYPVRLVAVLVMALQAPLLVLMAPLAGWAVIGLGLVLMLLVFGQIPINDVLVARYSSEAWRARLYALKYLLSLGVSAAAVPLIALLHDPGAGFERLFLVLGACAVAVTLAALALPAARRALAPAE